MIRNITSSGAMLSTQLANYVAQKNVTQSAVKTSDTSSAITDTVSIDPTSFSVTSPIEDYLPHEKHISSKKKFKNNKEYIAYLLLLDARMKKIEQKNGGAKTGFFAPLENRTEYNKLKNEMSELTSANIL